MEDFLMKKKLLAILLTTGTSAAYADISILPTDEIKEKAGFALGLTADQVNISNVRRSEALTVKFNAEAKGRVFQCYYQGDGSTTSDALCSPTDGKPMPASTACNDLTRAAGYCQ